MERDFAQYIASKLNAEVARLTEDLGLGKAKDHGEYKWSCGIIRGLMMANGIIQEAVQEVEHDDDE